jgi:uncharacterized protein YjiS (DUF1127 family)
VSAPDRVSNGPTAPSAEGFAAGAYGLQLDLSTPHGADRLGNVLAGRVRAGSASRTGQVRLGCRTGEEEAPGPIQMDRSSLPRQARFQQGRERTVRHVDLTKTKSNPENMSLVRPGFPADLWVIRGRHPPIRLRVTAMSIQSFNSRSSHTGLPALVELFGDALTLAYGWRDRSRQRQALLRLDDHMLRDIGLSGADVEREASKPFWRG